MFPTASPLMSSFLRFSRLFNWSVAATPRCFVSSTNDPNAVIKNPWSHDFRISKTRCNFPRPSEVYRIKKHGWEKRMSTPAGRKIIMNRILKGRHVLSH